MHRRSLQLGLAAVLALALVFAFAPRIEAALQTAAAGLPQHSIFIGHTAVNISYLINQPVEASQLVNDLLDDQELGMADLWYRIEDDPLLNVATGQPASPEVIFAIRDQLQWYVNEQGETEELDPPEVITASVDVSVYPLGFTEVTVSDVEGLDEATHFTVPERNKIAEVGESLIFLAVDEETTLQLTDADGTVLAEGVLDLDEGEYDVPMEPVED